MASPGFEPETFSVLDWRDNQLHHDTLMLKYLQCLIRRQSVMKGQRPKVVDSNKTAWRSFLLCLRASPPIYLSQIFIRLLFDSHPNLSDLNLSLSTNMTTALDMALDDIIKTNKQSSGSSNRGRARPSSGPGPARRLSSRSANRTGPYSTPKV